MTLLYGIIICLYLWHLHLFHCMHVHDIISRCPNCSWLWAIFNYTTGREQVFPGEMVVYRCTTNGSSLAWNLPPLHVSNVIVFDNSSLPESVQCRSQGEVLALLVTNTPAFESFLIIKPNVNVSFINVTCMDGSKTWLSKVYSIASKSYLFGVYLIIINWLWYSYMDCIISSIMHTVDS